MSIIGRRSLLRYCIDSLQVEPEPPARLGPSRFVASLGMIVPDERRAVSFALMRPDLRIEC